MDDYLGSISMYSFGFVPKGYAQCNGQLMPINANQALFSLLGTTYGGDGRVTFALPDFRGKSLMHFGNGYTQGQIGGEETHQLTINELPAHNHPATMDANSYIKAKAGTVADSISPDGNYYATNPALHGRFSNHADTGMFNNTINGTASNGSSQVHENRMPYLAIMFGIALTGIFPSRN